MSAFRPTTRILNFSRNVFRSPAFRQTPQRRLQSTAANANVPPQSGFAKFLNSPVGPKTVHFWYVLLQCPAAHVCRPKKKEVKAAMSRAIVLDAESSTQTTWADYSPTGLLS